MLNGFEVIAGMNLTTLLLPSRSAPKLKVLTFYTTRTFLVVFQIDAIEHQALFLVPIANCTPLPTWKPEALLNRLRSFKSRGGFRTGLYPRRIRRNLLIRSNIRCRLIKHRLASVFLGNILATVLASYVKRVARLSSNWLVSRFAAVYIEIFRNIPLLLQIFFLVFRAFSVSHLQDKSLSLGEAIFLNVRGLYFLFAPVLEQGSSIVIVVTDCW